MANQAAFTIEGTPSADPTTGDREYTALNSQTLTCTLETNPSQALRATFEVFDPANLESPLASKDAPLTTWNENAAASITVGVTPYGINAPVTIDMPPIPGGPATGIVSYIIRCTVATAGDGSPGSQEQVYERMVLVYGTTTTPAMRKTVPGESTEARARAWSDALNDLVDAVQNLIIGAGAVTSVFGRAGAVIAVVGDYLASQIPYSNATSGLAATEVQAAIDELAAVPTTTVVSTIGQYTVLAGVAVGEILYISGADAASVASNAAIGTMPAAGVVVAKPTPTTATMILLGRVTGLAGMTPGARQYVGVSGARVEAGALPTTPGSVIQQIGVAESATAMIFEPQQIVVL